MNLSFHKMSFSQVAHFLTQLQSYVQPVDLDEDQADPVDVSMDLSGFGDTKEQDAAGWLVLSCELPKAFSIWFN